MCGGLSKNAIFVQTHADVMGLPVVLPDVTESVLLGSAILAAAAYNSRGNAENDVETGSDVRSASDVKSSLACRDSPVVHAMKTMGGGGKEIAPRDQVVEFHAAKYKVFHKMLMTQRECVTLMREWEISGL